MAQANNDQNADIAIVVADLGSGGAQRVATTLANAWAAGGRAVTLIALDDGRSDAFGLDQAVRRVSLDCLGATATPVAGLVANLGRVRALRRALAASRAKRVLSFVGTTNVITVLAAAGLGLRVIISERNDPARQSLGRLWDWLRKQVYRSADLVTANSHGALETLRAFVPSAKLAYVPNPLVLPAAVTPIETQGPTILAVGRLDPQKAYDVLLAAFARTAARRNGWRLAILGEGPLEQALNDQAASLGLNDAVDWHGRVADPFPHYAGAEMFVLASRYEGTPNAVLEALGTGLPVIVSDAAGGALAFVGDGTTGLVVPVDDAIALATAIDRLADDAALRRRLGESGGAAVEDCYIERVLPVWERVVMAPHGRPRLAGDHFATARRALWQMTVLSWKAIRKQGKKTETR